MKKFGFLMGWLAAGVVGVSMEGYCEKKELAALEKSLNEQQPCGWNVGHASFIFALHLLPKDIDKSLFTQTEQVTRQQDISDSEYGIWTVTEKSVEERFHSDKMKKKVCKHFFNVMQRLHKFEYQKMKYEVDGYTIGDLLSVFEHNHHANVKKVESLFQINDFWSIAPYMNERALKMHYKEPSAERRTLDIRNVAEVFALSVPDFHNIPQAEWSTHDEPQGKMNIRLTFCENVAQYIRWVTKYERQNLLIDMDYSSGEIFDLIGATPRGGSLINLIVINDFWRHAPHLAARDDAAPVFFSRMPDNEIQAEQFKALPTPSYMVNPNEEFTPQCDPKNCVCM